MRCIRAAIAIAAILGTLGGTATAATEGIDVSKWQGTIDWNRVQAAGIDFAITRVSDGLGFRDEKFDRNWAEIKRIGIVRGAYQFFRPGQDAVAQANLLLSKIGTLGANDLPPVIDVEVRDGKSDAQIVAGVAAWIARVRAVTGRKPIIYASPGFWNPIAGTGRFAAEADIWVAHWGVTNPSVPRPWTTWKIHQYTSSGSVPGISGRVDRNRFNGTVAQLRAYAAASAQQSGPDYAARIGATHGVATMVEGETATFWVEYRNIGTKPWNSSTRLGTTDPRDHASPLYVQGNWIGNNRATAVDAATAAGNVGRFSFQVKAPQVTQPTTFTEKFRLVQESVTWFPASPDTLVTFTVRVLPRDWTAEVVRSSLPTTLDEGQTATGWIEFRNTGNKPWTPGKTKLGTTDPQDHASVLHTPGQWLGNNRMTDVDAATAPGAVGRYTFTITAPQVTSTQQITDKFRLVEENVSWFDRAPTDTLVTLTITVRNVPKPGDIEVITDPPGASVYLSGNPNYPGRLVGQSGASGAPLVVRGLPPRGFVLTIEGADRAPVQRRVDVPDGGVARVTETLGWKPAETFSALARLAAGGQPITAPGGFAAPVVVDWNSDGKLDVVLGRGDGKVDVLPGTSATKLEVGAAQPVRDAAGPISVGGAAVPFVVDWDNDDRKDLVIGRANGKVQVFPNTRTEADPLLGAPLTIQVAGADFIASGGNSSPWVVDWDGDAKKDLLVGAADGTVTLLLNTGTDAAPVFGGAPRSVSLAPGGPIVLGADAHPAAIDWNRDSLFDLGVGEHGGDVSRFVNSGAPAAPVFTSASGTLLALRANDRDLPIFALSGRLSLVDTDGDGLRELVIGTAAGEVSLAPGRKILADVDDSKVVDARDFIRLARALGARRGDARYAPELDLDGNGVIEAQDRTAVVTGFGRTY